MTLNKLILISITLFVVFLPRQAAASGFLITVQPGASDVPLALPLPATPAGDQWGDAEVLWNVVRRDLEMTGYFTIVDPDAYIDTSSSVEPGSFDFNDWRSINASALAKMRLTPVGHQIQADVYVYDINTGAKIIAKGYKGKPGDLRGLAHKIANAIVLALTGQPGFFNAQLAAVGSFSGNKEIYLLDIDGENAHNITRNGSINLSPAWSPSGNSIVWTTYKRGNPDLYVKQLSSGHTRVISAKDGINSGGAFSPNGQHIALTRSSGSDSDIYVVQSSDGAAVTRLTRERGIDVAPNYSSDGQSIVFASERSSGTQLYVQNVDGKEAKRISYTGTWNMDPVYSPDGMQVAYVTRAERFDIMVVDSDGKNPRRITQDMGDNEDPAWSPDGRYLIFSSTRRGPSEIWLSTADGRHQVPLTTSSTGWTQPTWAPEAK